jgi:hypothetical protein
LIFITVSNLAWNTSSEASRRFTVIAATPASSASRCWLQPKRARAARIQAPNAAAISDFFDVFLYADDVEALAAELTAKGAEIVHGPTYRPIWNGKELAVRDCNGRTLCFGQSMG